MCGCGCVGVGVCGRGVVACVIVGLLAYLVEDPAEGVVGSPDVAASAQGDVHHLVAVLTLHEHHHGARGAEDDPALEVDLVGHLIALQQQRAGGVVFVSAGIWQ